jgi:hypothetical protein
MRFIVIPDFSESNRPRRAELKVKKAYRAGLGSRNRREWRTGQFPDRWAGRLQRARKAGEWSRRLTMAGARRRQGDKKRARGEVRRSKMSRKPRLP